MRYVTLSTSPRCVAEVGKAKKIDQCGENAWLQGEPRKCPVACADEGNDLELGYQGRAKAMYGKVSGQDAVLNDNHS